MAVSFTNRLKTSPLSKARGDVWHRIADDILGSTYDLSIVFTGDAFMRRINCMYRHKDKPTNVLAFPISKDIGEIYLDIPYIRKESNMYDHRPDTHLDYLFIHGLLHLAGHDHGDTMERQEQRLMRKYIVL